jgi:hypothetical protein
MVASPDFTPRLDQAQALDCCARYASDEDIPAMVAGKAVLNGDFSPKHLDTIFRWKTKDRGKSRIRLNSDSEIVDALRLATLAKEPRSTMAVLMGLHGVATPVAAAVATAIYPSIHTMFDFRALEALGCTNHDMSLPAYLKYREFCLSLASEWNMTLRNLDRALWQWSADLSDVRHREKKTAASRTK